jgi:chorismate mutase/prephenate dehydratase
MSDSKADKAVSSTATPTGGASDEVLRTHRQRIDAVDQEIVRLLGERAAAAQAIGALKGGAPVYRPEREAQVLDAAAAGERGPLSPEAIRRVFVEIISACRGLERASRVAYLGPRGTFSEMAVTQHFGSSVDAVPFASMDEVFRAVEAGSVDFAVVPVENSTEGAVGRSLDLMLQTSRQVCGEVIVRVHQNLMTREAALSSVRRVYSHAQSLAQCHGWLSRNLPAAERVAVSSNAEAARLASGESGSAAIGPAIAAGHYGLRLHETNIEDETRNMTRFLVLGGQDSARSGRDRTSLVLSAHNRPGAVHELLSPLAEEGVSMSHIESRPARTGTWEYFFFIDIEGHRNDPPVARALERLAASAPFLKVFGSYPAVVDDSHGQA